LVELRVLMVSRSRTIALHELEKAWGKIDVIELRNTKSFFTNLLKTCLSKPRYDLVIAQEPLMKVGGFALIASLINHAPLVSEIHADYLWGERIPLKDRLILPIILRKSVMIRAVNKHLAEILKKYTDSRIVYLPSIYIDLDVFKPKKSIDEREKNILFAGRLERQKNPDLLVKAMKQVVNEVPDANLKIIGRGSMSRHLLGLVDKLDLNRHVKIEHGWISSEELSDEYNKACLFACVSSYEGGPRTVFEAAACMTPSVSTPVGIVPEVFKHLESVYMINGLDAGNVAKAIITMLEDSSLRRKIAENAYRITISEFEWRKTISQYASCYLELLRARR